MVASQYVWIGIAVGVFFAGIGIGYAVFQSSNQPNITATPDVQTELEKYKIAERLAAEHLKTFDELDFDVFTNQKWERLHESHSQDIIVHWPDGRKTEGIETHIEDLKAMFVFAPDTRIQEHPIRIASGEWTSVIGVMEGTFTEPMPLPDGRSIPPTGKPFKLMMATVGHWKDGVMDEEYLFWDNQAFMNQIGLGQATDSSQGVFANTLSYTKQPVSIDPQKGYSIVEIADGIYWLVGSGYQTMFLTTGEGVIVIDAPQPIGEKYIEAIGEVTDEPITHMIYSHHHQDHTGAAGQIFPSDITYVAHQETADVLAQENDPNRPIPTVTFDDTYTLSVGDQTLELYYVGNYHSNGDIAIYAPKQKVAMVVDLLRPGITPWKAFAATPDINQYLKTHDTLVEDFDFDVLVSGHTQILATKEHIKTNKQFTLDVMENARKALQMSDSDAVQTCVDTTIQQWEGKLGNLDEFMVEHCTTMINYVSQ